MVDDHLVLEELDEEELPEQDDEDVYDESDMPEAAAIPDLQADDIELEGLRRQVQCQPRQLPALTMPSFRSTPISEFNRSQALLSWAFPTLFLRGDAEFVTPRLREIPYPAFVKHLLLSRTADLLSTLDFGMLYSTQL